MPPLKKILLFTDPSRYIPVCLFLARNGTTFRSDKGVFTVQLHRNLHRVPADKKFRA